MGPYLNTLVRIILILGPTHNSDGAVLVPDPSPNWMSEIRRLEHLGDCISSFKANRPFLLEQC